MALPKTFSSGEYIAASEVNEAFEYLDGKLPGVALVSATTAGGGFPLEVEENDYLDISFLYPDGLFNFAPVVVLSLEIVSVEDDPEPEKLRAFVRFSTPTSIGYRVTNSSFSSGDVQFTLRAVFVRNLI